MIANTMNDDDKYYEGWWQVLWKMMANTMNEDDKYYERWWQIL